MVINTKLSDEELLKAIYKAAFEYSKLIGNSYLIIGKNKNSGYFGFQCQFQKKHFMHLLGIDSKTLSATVFYDKCDANMWILHMVMETWQRLASRNWGTHRFQLH